MLRCQHEKSFAGVQNFGHHLYTLVSRKLKYLLHNFHSRENIFIYFWFYFCHLTSFNSFQNAYLLEFIIKEDPLPDFNAYSIYDVISNFWILGLIIICSIPYFLCLYWYCSSTASYDNFGMIILHAVMFHNYQ